MGNREAVMDSITFSPFSEATYNILPPGFHKELKCIIHQYLARYWTVLGLKKLRGSSHRTSPANIRMSRGDRASHLPSSKCSNTQNTFSGGGIPKTLRGGRQRKVNYRREVLQRQILGQSIPSPLREWQINIPACSATWLYQPAACSDHWNPQPLMHVRDGDKRTMTLVFK